MSHTNATAAQVQEILDTDLTTSEIDPFLTAAQRIVTDTLESAGYADATLTEIERWLAAHLAAMRDQRVAEEKVGSASFTYEGQTGMGLDATRYGQQVQMLESKSLLSAISESRGSVQYRFSG